MTSKHLQRLSGGTINMDFRAGVYGRLQGVCLCLCLYTQEMRNTCHIHVAWAVSLAGLGTIPGTRVLFWGSVVLLLPQPPPPNLSCSAWTQLWLHWVTNKSNWEWTGWWAGTSMELTGPPPLCFTHLNSVNYVAGETTLITCQITTK